VVVACSLWGPVAAASPEADAIIETALKRCAARIEAHSRRATSARHAANILLVVGASTAALGSALAGFLTKAKLRKAMAIVGAAGAVLAVVPKTLDDPGEVRVLQKNAERHHDVAVKVQRQFIFFEDLTYKKRLAQYVIARLSDCEANEPPEKLPDLPLPSPAPSEGTPPTGSSAERILLNTGPDPSSEQALAYPVVDARYEDVAVVDARYENVAVLEDCGSDGIACLTVFVVSDDSLPAEVEEEPPAGFVLPAVSELPDAGLQ
jgi:hypothetical protein